MFNYIFHAVTRLLIDRAEPYMTCPLCQEHGHLVWFCVVQCDRCKATWKWVKRNGAWEREMVHQREEKDDA